MSDEFACAVFAKSFGAVSKSDCMMRLHALVKRDFVGIRDADVRGGVEKLNEAIRFQAAGVEADGKPLLADITGTVERGRTVALIGPSGAGKSTLLSICNLMKTPSRGSVFVDGKEVRSWDVRALRQKVGMVFQTATMFPGTVAENLAFGGKLHGLEAIDVRKILRDVGLSEDLLSKKAETLSGGEKQRVALGRTLAMKPDVLLLDEVTSALDVHAKQEVEHTILRLRAEHGTTLLWVTHDLAQARRVADDVWFLSTGRLMEREEANRFFQGPTSEIAQTFLRNELELRGETE